MWRPIQIELQSIDIKDCDLERDLSTVLLSISDIHFFFFTFKKNSFFQLARLFPQLYSFLIPTLQNQNLIQVQQHNFIKVSSKILETCGAATKMLLFVIIMDTLLFVD